MQYLKADATATILIGPFVAPADGVTPVTNITLGAADHAELMKHDGTTFVDLTSDSRTFTHKEGGFYTLALATGDMDTEGRLTVVIMDTSACLPVWKDFMVVNANVYDSLFATATTDYLQTDVTQIGGTAVPNTSGKLHVLDDAGATLANESAQTTIDTEVGDLQTMLTDIHDTDLPAVKTDTEAIIADTEDLQTQIGTDGAGLTDLGGMSTTMKGQVESEVTDSLIAHNLDHLMKTAVANRDVIAEVVDGTVLANIMTKTDGDASDFDPDTDSLEAIRDNQGGSAASIADAVWDETLSDHQTAGDTGRALKRATGRKLLD